MADHCCTRPMLPTEKCEADIRSVSREMVTRIDFGKGHGVIGDPYRIETLYYLDDGTALVDREIVFRRAKPKD